MIKKILAMTIMSCFVVSAFAADDSDAAQTQIAENCKPYLMADAVPQNLGEKADAALQACYNNNSCGNDALLDVKNCTKKLLGWQATFSLPKINEGKQKKTTSTTKTKSTQTNNVGTPTAATSDTSEVAPANLNDDTTTSTPSNNTPQKKKPSINWF